jgi:hypothetical protein
LTRAISPGPSVACTTAHQHTFDMNYQAKKNP